ncbi:MAG: hypothetical protein WC603_02655 [Candidatus Paceibacterota bacterium]
MKNSNKDFFEKIPGFLATIDEIKTNGFFDTMNSNIQGSEGVLMGIIFNGIGYIPSSKKERKLGINPIIDVQSILQEIKKQITEETRIVHSVYSEVKTEKWPLWDEPGENIIGEKGTKINFSFNVFFKL